jgi:K(+)-stimulated pyrophosphate-energized sodium pump
MALLAAYLEEVRLWLGRLASETVEGVKQVGDIVFYTGTQEPLVADGERAVSIASAHVNDFVQAYDLSIFNPMLLGGLFIGAMMAFLFCAMTMKAVGRAAGAMVEEVRRQFREIPGIMEGKAVPEYAKCVEISTKGAQKEMLVPSLIAIIVPVAVGVTLDVAGVIGLLAGGLTSGFTLAVMLNNAGGAWDNAKKYIEKGNHGGKGSDAHKAAVTGDTVGDPFKDTSGPSLNILIKLMTMVSVVMAGLTVAFNIF